MGNRAFIMVQKKDHYDAKGFYIHWNGGPESVYAFAEFASRLLKDDDKSIKTVAETLRKVAAVVVENPDPVVDCNIPFARKHYSNGDGGIYVFDTDLNIKCRFLGYAAERDLSTDEIIKEYANILKHPYWTGINKDETIMEYIEKHYKE